MGQSLFLEPSSCPNRDRLGLVCLICLPAILLPEYWLGQNLTTDNTISPGLCFGSCTFYPVYLLPSSSECRWVEGIPLVVLFACFSSAPNSCGRGPNCIVAHVPGNDIVFSG